MVRVFFSEQVIRLVRSWLSHLSRLLSRRSTGFTGVIVRSVLSVGMLTSLLEAASPTYMANASNVMRDVSHNLNSRHEGSVVACFYFTDSPCKRHASQSPSNKVYMQFCDPRLLVFLKYTRQFTRVCSLHFCNLLIVFLCQVVTATTIFLKHGYLLAN
jgi:hypothetical protein